MNNRPRLLRRTTTALLAALVLTCAAAPGHAQSDSTNIEALAQKSHDARIERLWRAQWREYAGSYFLYEGQAHLIRNYHPRSKSSLALTEEQIKNMTLQLVWKERIGNAYIEQQKDLPPPDEDVSFARSILPRLSVGHWGYIYAVKIDGPPPADNTQTIRVKDLTYLDSKKLARERKAAVDVVKQDIRGQATSMNVNAKDIVDFNFRFRDQANKLPSKPILMTGFDWPARLGEDDTWVGPFHAVLIDRGLGLEAIPVAKIKPGLTEEQFIAMLEARGKSKQAFAELIAEALDRRLPTTKRDLAIRHWLEDRQVQLASADEKPDKPKAEPADARPADDKPTETEPAAATDTTAVAATEPEPTATQSARRQLDDYLSGIEEEQEPDPTKSIFDFGRD